MEQRASRLALSCGRDGKEILLNDNVDLVRNEASNRESDAIGVRTRFRDVVGRIAVGSLTGPIDKKSNSGSNPTVERKKGVNSLRMGHPPGER